MYKYLLILLCVVTTHVANAQNPNELYVNINKGKAQAQYYVQKDDNLYSIAQLFSVPAILLSQDNDIPFYETLEVGRKIGIPIGNFNYSSISTSNQKQLIYIAGLADNYDLIARATGISITDILSLNNNQPIEQLSNNKVVLGWIQHNLPTPIPTKTETQLPTSLPIATTTTKDSTDKIISIGAPSEFENAYKYQTNNETYLDSLEGMVVFFKPQTSVNEKMLYAFSNDLARGRILKVYNPSNHRFVLTKVIGKLPNTKQYLNAKIGLDGRAREMLETREVKLWCSFYFKY